MQSILDGITQAISSVLDWFVAAFNGVSEIFYTEADGLSFLGYLLIIPAATIIVRFVFNFVVKLIKNIGR